MTTVLITALAKFVAALGAAVMAFRNLRAETEKYDKEKAAKKAAEEQQQ